VPLDAGDDRPERFWLTFALALERAVPAASTRAAEGAADVHRLPPEFASRLLTAWPAVTDPLVLALEDAHHLDSPEITEDPGFVVEHLPGPFGMLLTSRADPHLPVSRWRGRGWLAEIRQRDLALTLPETAERLAEPDLEFRALCARRAAARFLNPATGAGPGDRLPGPAGEAEPGG